MATTFCISHNHDDFHGLIFQIVQRSLGYTDSQMFKTDQTSPYKDYYYFGESQTATEVTNKTASALKTYLDDQATTDGTSNGLVWQVQGDKSNCIYGDIHNNEVSDGVRNIDTTLYDKIVSMANSKVIHCTWSDWTHSSWTTTFKNRIEAVRAANSLPAVSNQTERLKHFSDNMAAITYPSDGKSFVLYQDKIIDKDATHYTELCSFLGVTTLGTSTWNGYVDAYTSYIAS